MRVTEPLRGRDARGWPFISAHRGAVQPGVKADLSAYEHAVASGADFIEFDVRATADGALVASHEDTAGGLCIAEHSLADLSSAGCAPPLVDQILDLAADRVKLHVDLKDRGTEETAVAILRAHAAPSDFVLTSLEDDVVSSLKRAHPDLCVGLSLGRDKPVQWLRTRVSELFPLGRLTRCGADFIAVHYRLARLGVLRQSAHRNIPAFVWTVNDEDALATLLRNDRVTTVVTDVPERAISIVEKMREVR